MPIAGAGAGLHGWHLSEFRALGGIGEGFVSRLGAQGLLVYFVKASQPLPVLRLLNHRMAGGLGVEVAWGGLCTC